MHAMHGGMAGQNEMLDKRVDMLEKRLDMMQMMMQMQMQMQMDGMGRFAR